MYMGIFHVPKKLFDGGRFSRQSAFRAVISAAKRAAKTSAKTFLQEAVFQKCRQTDSQIAHLSGERGLFGWCR
jgi:hypothetical protein